MLYTVDSAVQLHRQYLAKLVKNKNREKGKKAPHTFKCIRCDPLQNKTFCTMCDKPFIIMKRNDTLRPLALLISDLRLKVPPSRP